MTTIEKDGFRFLVDIEKTREYYRTQTLCTCLYCQHLHSRIRGMFPELEAFLASFGIDIAKPDETAPFDSGESFLYSFAGYTVCGKILADPGNKIRIEGNPPFTVSCEPGFAFPNEQMGEYFSLSVSDFELPLSEKNSRNDGPKEINS